MNYELLISDNADRILSKLRKDDLRRIQKKILQILENPHHFKPLRGDMHGARRVHVNRSFVLTYDIIANTIRILDYNHHDKIY
jgi:YafQ family addiction module toxin component